MSSVPSKMYPDLLLNKAGVKGTFESTFGPSHPWIKKSIFNLGLGIHFWKTALGNVERLFSICCLWVERANCIYWEKLAREWTPAVQTPEIQGGTVIHVRVISGNACGALGKWERKGEEARKGPLSSKPPPWASGASSHWGSHQGQCRKCLRVFLPKGKTAGHPQIPFIPWLRLLPGAFLLWHFWPAAGRSKGLRQPSENSGPVAGAESWRMASWTCKWSKCWWDVEASGKAYYPCTAGNRQNDHGKGRPGVLWAMSQYIGSYVGTSKQTLLA